MGLPEIWSEFYIQGDAVLPTVVSQRLGMLASKQYTKGEGIVDGNGKRLTNSWILSVGPERSHRLDTQVLRLIEMLVPATSKIAKLARDLAIEPRIYCVAYVADETPKIAFSRRVVAWANEVGATLEVDVFVGDEGSLRDPGQGTKV